MRGEVAASLMVIWPPGARAGRKNQLPGPVVVWQPAAVRADADRLSEGRRQVSTTVAGVFAPAPLTAQLRSTTRARLFFTQWRVQDPPRYAAFPRRRTHLGQTR